MQPSALEAGSFTVRVFPNIGTEEGQCNVAYCSVLLRVDYGLKENQTNFTLVENESIDVDAESLSILENFVYEITAHSEASVYDVILGLRNQLELVNPHTLGALKSK